MTGADAPAPYRTSFDNARDPYTARNALGLTATAAAVIGAASTADFPATEWTAWTPTISASSGTITSTTLNTARYIKLGKTVIAFVDITITNAGTGAGTLLFTLPVTAGAAGGLCFGRETAVTNYMHGGHISPSDTLGRMIRYDGATMITVNYRLRSEAIYEAA